MSDTQSFGRRKFIGRLAGIPALLTAALSPIAELDDR